MILMLRLALVGLTLHQIGIPPGQSIEAAVERKDLVHRVGISARSRYRDEDRGCGTGGDWVEEGGTTKRVRDQRQKGLKG